MTKKEIINAIFEEENKLTDSQFAYVMSLPKDKLEYAYDVYSLLVVQRPNQCGNHFRLIEKLLLGVSQQVVYGGKQQ